MKISPRGTVDFRSSGNLITVKRKDNNDVIMVSNFETYKMSSTQRCDEIQKKYIVGDGHPTLSLNDRIVVLR